MEEGSCSLHRAQNLEIWKCGNAIQAQSRLPLTFVCGVHVLFAKPCLLE